MNKFKKILVAVAPLLALSSLSCTNKSQNITISNNISNYQESNQWNLFINQDAIQSILTTIYDNPESIQSYLDSQLNINEDYTRILNESLVFNNSLSLSFGSDSGGFLSSVPKPFPLRELDKQIQDLFEHNWLWYLFNLNKAEFIYYPQFDRFETNSESIKLDTLQNSLSNSSFFRPLSNKILQFSKQYYEDSQEYKTYNFFLLLDGGFILKLQVDKYFEDGKWDTSINLDSYIYSYPYIFNKENVNNIFNISKYVSDTQSFFELSENRSKSILFKENYGSSELRFTLSAIKK
ncbi:aromatic motif membrane protein [Mycoplasmopsis columboralis]|uniref:Lipoprotein n=1 Tax=Mycoplasmopsis columboralis TaxID=171282 RepID=A0A449B6S9_9BACT|nr:aromatic motif membrane protein [Mycoplasmopsis columboralis]VEU76316.1 Uncharacterised protein [Mycoplasmopsis columboralis]